MRAWFSMNTVTNTFNDANTALSQSIYQLFSNGSVINRKIYSEANASFIEYPEYREIAVNEAHYKNFYWHLGYLLDHDTEGDYYHLSRAQEQDSDTEDFDEASLKIMAVLTIISRFVTNRGQALDTLTLPVQGITNADLDAIAEDEETLSIIKSLKLKDCNDALAFLRKRGFAFKVNNKRHVLSKGANSMIDTIIERQKSMELVDDC